MPSVVRPGERTGHRCTGSDLLCSCRRIHSLARSYNPLGARPQRHPPEPPTAHRTSPRQAHAITDQSQHSSAFPSRDFGPHRTQPRAVANWLVWANGATRASIAHPPRPQTKHNLPTSSKDHSLRTQSSAAALPDLFASCPQEAGCLTWPPPTHRRARAWPAAAGSASASLRFRHSPFRRSCANVWRCNSCWAVGSLTFDSHRTDVSVTR